MFHVLTDLLLAHERGRTDEAPHQPTPPHHLVNQPWKYVCPCGYTWKHEADAVWRQGYWQAPVRQCVSCFDWVHGSHLTPIPENLT